MLRLGMNDLTTLLNYGKEWQKHRKIFQEGLRKNLMPGYAQLQTEKLNIILKDLLRSPEGFAGHIKWYVAQVPLLITVTNLVCT